MTRWAILLLPVAGLLAHDPLRFDVFGLKELVLTAGALLVGLLFAADAWRTGRPRLGWSDLSGALVVFLLVRGLMVWRAPEAGAEARSWALLLGLVLVHHICCASVSSAWLRRRAVPVLAATFGLLSALALVQASGLLEVRQVYGLFANRSFAGAGLAMLLPFALADERRRARVYVVLGLLALVTTQSRTGAIAAAAALALYFGWNRPRWRLPLLGSVVLAVLVVGVAFGERNTVKVRLHWYEAALKLGAAQPALGHGAGGFGREYPPIRPVEEHSISGGRRVHAVHDDYLQSWADGGALGLAAHLLLLLMVARAARRSRPAAASLLAFGTASLVDLPLQDPSLLALAFLCLQMTARRRRTRVLTAPAFLSVYPALLAFSLFVVPAWSHWRADRQLASALEARQARTEWRAALDRCLELEPGYADALEERGHAGDLEALLLQRPHDGHAHFLLAQRRAPDDIAGFEQILEKHDPHHVGTLVRLAELRMEADPLAAVSYLRRALAADPRRYLPYLTFARLRRLQGQYDEAFRMLEEAVQRSNTPAIFLEAIDLTLELSRNKKIAVAERDWRLRLSVRRAPRRLVIRRVDAALDAAQLIKQELEASRPRVQARPGENAIDYARRVQAAKAGWTRDLQARTRPEYAEAQVLTAVLLEVEPDAALLERAAEAARGLGDLAGAARLEAYSLFVDGLDALRRGDERVASVRFRRALRADPFFGRVEGVPEALALFLRENPGVPRDSEALQVLARVEELRRVMAPAD